MLDWPGDEVTDEEPPPADVGPVGDVDALVLPLDRYIVSRMGVTDPALRAQWVLVAKYVQRFGLEWTPPAPRNSPENISAPYFYLCSEESARRVGYHSEYTPPEHTPWSDDLTVVLVGRGPKRFAGVEVPEGGCYGEARRYLAQGTPVFENEQFGLQLKNAASTDAKRDARVQEGFAAGVSAWNRRATTTPPPGTPTTIRAGADRPPARSRSRPPSPTSGASGRPGCSTSGLR